jgi:hypothetical protein
MGRKEMFEIFPDLFFLVITRLFPGLHAAIQIPHVGIFPGSKLLRS